jgi:hypothetical protein
MGPLSSHPQHVGADRNPQCMQYVSGFQRKEYEGVIQHASYRPIKSLCRVILPHKSRLLSTSVSMHTTHFTVPDTRGNGCREREIDGVNEREKRRSTDCKGKELKGHDTEVMEVYGFRWGRSTAMASSSTSNSQTSCDGMQHVAAWICGIGSSCLPTLRRALRSLKAALNKSPDYRQLSPNEHTCLMLAARSCNQHTLAESTPHQHLMVLVMVLVWKKGHRF